MKKTTKTDFRVVVYPRRLGDYGIVSMSDSVLHKPDEIEKEYLERCDDIAEEIKRHVDQVGGVHVEFDTTETCSHCGYPWDESPDDSDPDFPKGCPVCCDEAAEEWKAANQTEAAP